MFLPLWSGTMALVITTEGRASVGAGAVRMSGPLLGPWLDGQADSRRIAFWLAVGIGLIVATGVAASGLGALGAAVVLLPTAMVAYSAAMTAAATADERRESAAIEQANTDLRRFVLGETSVLVGLAREQQ